MLEVLIVSYFVASVLFFVALISDKRVNKNAGVILVYILASIFWPLSGGFYLIDRGLER
jgi:hypothetical protein